MMFQVNKNVDSDESNKKSQEIENEEEVAYAYAMQLCTSTVLSMSLQSATELGVFDILQKAGPGAMLSAEEIASQLSCKNKEAPSMLDRVLGLLASHSILLCTVHQNKRLYSMTPVAKYFAPDFDGFSLGPFLALIQDNVPLKDAIREGGIPFERVHGTPAYEYPSFDSRFNQVFNAAMISNTSLVTKKVLEFYKGFEDIKRLVDVGGGHGISINLITSKYPHIQGINFDLPHVIEHAPLYPGMNFVQLSVF
ncbi:hypothetical protein RIF29_21654 [Crotalaria pallida]|uniref:O-methyltransferase n=1 Tax=Crotalaria pallida TaxID=3830 RepID=A0AAN9I8N6_CROPI